MTMEPTRPYRRRQYFIKRKFQGRFILQFSLLILVGCAAFGLAVYLYSTQTLTTAFIDSKLRVMSTANFLLPAILLIALIVTTAVALTGAVRLLLFSHKIAGPLYRLEKSAEAVQAGKLDFQVRLRSGDELQDFAHSMDAMVRELRTRARTIKDQNERLKEVVREAGRGNALPKEVLDTLKDTQSKLDEAVSRFQV